MPESLVPVVTYQALVVVHVLHLLHHRLARRDIGSAEIATGATLCVQPLLFAWVPALLLVAAHVVLFQVQFLHSWEMRRIPVQRVRG